ncbi:MAG: hypothetical protein QGH93_00410 [Gammaproteobacteria bacterium]|jgi:hypothetical protein|nr:hypothetical protein [Gammaproteobacteria bacterium]
MEWVPKLLDNIDSSLLALHQSWAGYYRWILFRLLGTVMVVTALSVSPAVRHLAIAMVMTYACLEAADRVIVRYKLPCMVRSRS